MGWRPHLSFPASVRSMKRPSMTRRDDSLIGQIVAANVVLVAITLFAASLAAGLDLTVADQRWSFLILALAIILTLWSLGGHSLRRRPGAALADKPFTSFLTVRAR